MEINNPLLLAIPGAIIVLIVLFLLFRKGAGLKTLRVKLVDKKHITHDSIIFTFLLPEKDKNLGLKIGEHIEIQYFFLYSGKPSRENLSRENILLSQLLIEWVLSNSFSKSIIQINSSLTEELCPLI